jgi:DNA modification methylase
MNELYLDKIVCGDALELTRQLESDSIDTIITSPPYWGLRDYGEETKIVWDGDENCRHKWEDVTGKKYGGGTNTIIGQHKDEHTHFTSKSSFCQKCGAWYGQLGLEPTLNLYLKHLLQITAELKRVLKPTGVMFWNHGDSYGGGCNTNDRKKIVPKTQFNLPTNELEAKCLVMQNYRLILKMIGEQGWILRNTIIWHKPNHMPSSVRDRFASAYEPIFMLTKSKRYWFDLDAVRMPHSRDWIGCGGNLAGKGTHKLNDGFKDIGDRTDLIPNPLGKNPGDIWEIPTQPFPESHFATFPEKLIEPLIKAGCPAEICKKCGKARERIVKSELVGASTKRGGHIVGNGQVQGNVYNIPRENAKKETIGWTDCGCNAGFENGVILDPFLGAGTTALVALKLNRRFIGFELNPEYCKIAEQRIRPWILQERLEV